MREAFCRVCGPLSAPLMTAAIGVAEAATSAEDIRDIRGPKWVLPAWLIPVLVAAAVLLALVVFFGWRRRRRRPRNLLPFELALRRLEDSRSLMQPARASDFSVAASDIVRTYIEQQFNVTATLRTTEEFLRDLVESSNASLASHRALLSEFLHQCDLAKFAGMTLTMESMESLYRSACAFVSETGRHSGIPSTEPHDSLPPT